MSRRLLLSSSIVAARSNLALTLTLLLPAGRRECADPLLTLLIVLASGLRQSRLECGKEASCFASRYDAVIEGQRQRQYAADDLLSLVDDHA
jgi:hypothetical protein